MTGFKLAGAVAILCALIAAPAEAHGIEGRDNAAPLWRAACVADHGEGMCQRARVDGARGGHARKNDAPSPVVAPSNANDGWPANMILG